MEYRNLGNTGLKVSAISLGCEGFIGKSAAEVKADFDYAIGRGVNFIDIYSPNPDLRSNIGAALKGRRESFYIQGHLCTMWQDGQYLRTRDSANILPAFNKQLEELDTDYVDVGMIHYVDTEDDFHRVFDGEIIRIALRLKEQGRIRHIGMSSHNPVIAKMALETGLVEVLLFSINPAYDLQPADTDIYAMFEQSTFEASRQNIDPARAELYELCERVGVGIDVMKVFGGGDLLSESGSPFGKAMTPVQAIDYALSRPGVAAVMVGCKSREEIAAALSWCDATPQMRDYSGVLANLDRFSWKGHCMYCGHCAPCTAQIDIAAVNKFYNLAVAQGEIPETVREHYKALSHHAGECVGCGECETRCPFDVEIVRGMSKAAELFGY